jgi:hypothetical protein
MLRSEFSGLFACLGFFLFLDPTVAGGTPPNLTSLGASITLTHYQASLTITIAIIIQRFLHTTAQENSQEAK